MQQKDNPTYSQLFLFFVWTGFTAFGGLAMTAYVRKKITEKKKWLDEKTFDSGLALCQIIPGAIIMQLVAYIGLKMKGIRGAVVSFIGFGLPAFLIMLILSVFYKHSKNVGSVEQVLGVLRVVIIAIVANAAYIFASKNFRNVNDWIIGALATGLFLTRLHPALVLLLAAFIGIILTKKEFSLSEKPVRVNTFKFFLGLLALVAVCTGILLIVNKSYFTLATVMLRIDLFSFGGGLAATPIMYHELVDVYKWFDPKTFMDGIILGQVTPGSIIIAATFFGYVHFGITGSILATICVFTPSFLILMGIIPFFDKLKTYPQFNKGINGILCSFVGLLAVITFRFGMGIHWNPANSIIAVAAFILLMFKIDVLWVIIGGMLVSLVIF
jgi:chromate transporter